MTRSSAVARRNQVVAAQITRTVYQLPSEVALSQRDGMPRPCVVNCDVMLAVPKARLVRHVTTLSPAKMDEVHAALRFALEIP